MVQTALKFPEHADALERFERIVDNAEVARELGTLLGRAPLFAEFTQDDIKGLAEYMGVYRAQPNETIIREGSLELPMRMVSSADQSFFVITLAANMHAVDVFFKKAQGSLKIVGIHRK